MVLVLALLLTTLCGAHAASIPSDSPDLLASKSVSKLEKRETPNLDKVRHSVLEDMKRMLDSQLATLFESALTRKAGSKRKRLNPKTKPHTILKPSEASPNFESLIPEEGSPNSEFIKVLTDDSLQDPNDELLRNAVDQLLKENEGVRLDNIDNSEVYENDNQLNGDNSTINKSEEFFGDDAFEVATLPINTTDKVRKKGKSIKKAVNHDIIGHIPKNNKNDDDDEDILDLDKILKSALKDFSGSLSQEDENSRDEDKEDGDLGTNNEKDSYQFDEINNVDVDENTLRTVKNSEDNAYNEELETHQILTNNNKTNRHKHIHQHRKKSKGRQPINYNVSHENHTLIRDDNNRAGKDFNKDDNDTKDKVKISHDERQRPFKKYKNRHGKNHPNKNHHSKRRSRNHDKHEQHNDNKTHDHGTKDQHLIVRLNSDSDGSNESKLDTLHDIPTHKKRTHIISSNIREGHQDSKNKIYYRDSYDSSESKENAISEGHSSQDNDEDKKNLTEIEDPNNEHEENNTISNITNEDISDSKENDFVRRKKIKDLAQIDDESITREGNKKTVETGKGKEKNTDYKDKILNENKLHVEDSEKDVITRTEKVPVVKNKASKELDDTEAKTRISDSEEDSNKDGGLVAGKEKIPKNDETHTCHHEQIGNENDETNLIHDLLHNKEMKKSYSLSLTLSTN